MDCGGATSGIRRRLQNSDLTESEIGCFASHYLLLKDNAQPGVLLHVLEDDVLFSRYTKPNTGTHIAEGRWGL